MSFSAIAPTPQGPSPWVPTGADMAAAPPEDEALALAPAGLLIDGEFVDAAGGRTLGVEDPATGRTLVEVADASPADCLAALEAAVAAQASWAASAPRERSRILRRAAERLRDQIEALARILTAEMGKPLAESRAEVEFAADYLEWFAEGAVRIAGRTSTSPDGNSRTWSCAPRSGRAS